MVLVHNAPAPGGAVSTKDHGVGATDHRATAHARPLAPAPPAPAASWFPRRPRTCARPGLTADHQIPAPSMPLGPVAPEQAAIASHHDARGAASEPPPMTPTARPPDRDRQLLPLARAGLVPRMRTPPVTSHLPPPVIRGPWVRGKQATEAGGALPSVLLVPGGRPAGVIGRFI
jgi:hypothetical protein